MHICFGIFIYSSDKNDQETKILNLDYFFSHIENTHKLGQPQAFTPRLVFLFTANGIFLRLFTFKEPYFI